MAFTLSQLCGCGQAAYAGLRARVDRCAELGYSYELPPCLLPGGCTPSSCTLGLWRAREGYVLYLRPAVHYAGEGTALRRFFSGNSWLFPDFSTLIHTLTGLVPQTTPYSPLFSALCADFQERVLGQEAAVEALSFRLYGHLGKTSPRRPLSLIFYGPTGVGKSELAKSIAPVLAHRCPERGWRTMWVELNTFTESHSAYRLTGAPPGYVGYDDPPIFECVRHQPDTVFVFDELEKAHPDILKLFMSILDEGRCTARREGEDGSRELDFRRCVFVFTTNYDLSGHTPPLGFALPQEPPRPTPLEGTLAQRLFQADEAARQALTRTGVLREIAGRFSGLIGFRPLGPQARAAVTVLQIKALGREHGLSIEAVDPETAASLTPAEALSPRSTVGVLEGLLTPLLTLYAGSSFPLRLSGISPDLVLSSL